jgi:chemotaxis protein CheX
MSTEKINESDLKLFVESIKRYFSVTTNEEPIVTSAYLATENIEGFEFNGLVSFIGGYSGNVIVSMPAKMLRRLLVLQHETDMSNDNLLDAVGEIANTLAGNARKHFGGTLDISVPVKFQGKISDSQGTRTRVHRRPFAITLSWGHYQAIVCVDLEKKY